MIRRQLNELIISTGHTNQLLENKYNKNSIIIILNLK